MKNNYNYILNGISHEINIDSKIKILSDPLDEKKLLSNKFMLKILNDLFEYLSIDYTIINSTLIGYKIFKGINIFEEDLEILIEKSNIKKLLKEEQYLLDNDIVIENFNDKFLIIKTLFFLNTEVISYIYLFQTENNILNFYDKNNNIYNLNFYDIFPIQKNLIEEFNINIPNKVDSVLTLCGYNLNFIIFKSYKAIVKKFYIDHIEVFQTIIYILFIYLHQNKLINL